MEGDWTFSKIGPHIMGGYSGTPATNSTPVIKLVDPDLEGIYLSQIAEKYPKALIVLRWTWNQDGALRNSETADAAARGWFQHYVTPRIQAACVRAGRRVVFEGYNEPPDGQHRYYTTFEVERLFLLHSIGLSAAVLSTSVGTPDLPVWAQYRPILNSMIDGDVVALHEYWIDRADIDNRWHCCRFDQYEARQALCDRPIVVTECGRDVVEGRGSRGWRQSCTEKEFMQDLAIYSRKLMEYPNVVGATPFTLPSLDPQWRAFDCSSIWASILAAQSGPLPPMPEPAPPSPTLQGMLKSTELDNTTIYQLYARAHHLGYVVSQVFYVVVGGIGFSAQGFEKAIIYGPTETGYDGLQHMSRATPDTNGR